MSAHEALTASDIRGEPSYRQAEQLFRTLRRPGSGHVSDAAEVHVSPDERHAALTAWVVEGVHDLMPTRIAETDLESGATRILTQGSHSERLPRYSPDGRLIAFLSDRARPEDFQLCLLERATGEVHTSAQVSGWIEYLHWSPDGTRILVGVAGHGADVAGGQGAVASRSAMQPQEDWMPRIERKPKDYQWRRAWVHHLIDGRLSPIDMPGLNVWEMAWCGDDNIVAVVSDSPEEGSWYHAWACKVDTCDGRIHEIYRPSNSRQLGGISGSPSGECIAVIEAISSDRGFVAGDLILLTDRPHRAIRVDTLGVDVTFVEWQSDRHLLIAGLRGVETVVGYYDRATEAFTEVWCDQTRTAGVRYPTLSALKDPGDCVLVGEGFDQAPELAIIREGRYGAVRSFDLAPESLANLLGSVRAVTWHSADDLEIQGWLLTPRSGDAPYPVVMVVHGGPVWSSRPTWLGRSLSLALLLARGYALFLPNPRGSSGRGQAYAQLVVGDMGGG